MDGKTLGTLSVHPMTADDEKNACVDGWGSTGITLRQHFAGLAMQGFCANPSVFAPNGMRGWGLVNTTEENLTNYALVMADALLAELSKDTP